MVQIPTIILGIFTGIFLTRALGPEGKGEYTFILANIELFTLFFGIGAENGLVYFGANKKISGNQLGGIVSIIYLSATLLFGVLLLIDFWVDRWVLFNDSKPLGVYVFMLCYFFLGLVTTYCSSFIRSIFQFKIVNRINLANSITNFLVFGYLFIQMKWIGVSYSVTEILLISFITLLLNVFIWIAYYIKYIGLWPHIFRFKKHDFFHFFRYTFIGYLGMLVNFFNYKIDLWFIGYYTNSQQLGLYSTAVNTAQFLLLFSRTLSMILQPYLSKFSVQKRLEQFKVYSRINFSLILVGSMVLIPGASFFIRLLFGSEFEGSVESFRILVIAMIFLCCNQLLYIYYASSDLNGINLKANLVGLIVCVISNVFLIPWYGIIGAAITSVICYAVIFLVLYGYYLWKFKISGGNIFIPRKTDFRHLFDLDVETQDK